MVWEVDMQAAYRHRNRMQRMYYAINPASKTPLEGLWGVFRAPNIPPILRLRLGGYFGGSFHKSAKVYPPSLFDLNYSVI